MQKNSKLDVEELIRATHKIYENKYDNPILKEEQKIQVEKFVINSSNRLCSKVLKKINVGFL